MLSYFDVNTELKLLKHYLAVQYCKQNNTKTIDNYHRRVRQIN